jgi:hypothetical protein
MPQCRICDRPPYLVNPYFAGVLGFIVGLVASIDPARQDTMKSMVDELSTERGESVVFCQPNIPELIGILPQYIVECCGDWTDWDTRRFGGDSFRTAITKAVTAKREWKKTNKTEGKDPPGRNR